MIGAAGRGKQEAVRRLGAHQALDYERPGWDSEVRAITRGRGVDVILEMRGGAVYKDALPLVAPMGGSPSGHAEAFLRRDELSRRMAARRRRDLVRFTDHSKTGRIPAT